VQTHVRGLAEALLDRGHQAFVLAPTTDGCALPAHVCCAGRAVAVPYNGAVARICFGPVANTRVRRWLRETKPDVLHVHEPGTPSVALLALRAAEVPVVATFHMSHVHSRAVAATAGILRPAMEKVTARIAVSESARDTVASHEGCEPVVIPNGLDVERFATASAREDWRGEQGTVAFVGRLDEPRKGWPVLAEALDIVARVRPGVRLLVVGGGDIAVARDLLSPAARPAVTFLGRVGDEDKAVAVRTADVYVAPNTGGESFGIVIAEAMAVGTTVLASDLPAFRRVLGDGRHGVLCRVRDSDALARELASLLDQPARRARLEQSARTAVRRYDWSVVAPQVLRVYQAVTGM
jgi:phosphatidylinositol alpha-mannosyltransferase